MDPGPVEDRGGAAPAGAAPGEGSGGRPLRADARRNVEAVLAAAKEVFARSGVDAPVREVAEAAGVGTATIYRHFPRRSDLVSAVFRSEVDACADAAPGLVAEHEPGEALERWLLRYAGFIAAKQGLAAALHSGDPAFDALPGYFDQRFQPVLSSLLAAAAEAGEIRADIDANDLLRAVAALCHSSDRHRSGHAERMVGLLVDGLRHGARTTT